MLGVLRTAFFVACSWTWCIGMFLPVLLIRDFGWWAWVAFALPNVVGAMCVGLILDPAKARRMLEEHRWVVGGFIAWTVAFHAYFLAYWLGQYGVARGAAPFLWLVVIGLCIPMFRRRFSTLGGVAVVVWFVSMAIFWWLDRSAGGAALAVPPERGDHAMIGLAGLVPALMLGFLACPFLDASLLRARAETPGVGGRVAFVLGFGVLFLILIGMTAMYSVMFTPEGRISHWIYAYFAVQGWFTVSALGREGRTLGYGRAGWAAAGGLVLLAGIAGMAVPSEGFEFGYELMLSAYALVFPAYVWTVVLGWGCGRRERVVGWLVTMVASSPFFVAGALFERWLALPLGVAIVLLGPLVAVGLGRLGVGGKAASEG